MNPFCAELIGTALLILLGNGVVSNALLTKTKANGASNWLLITMGWALAVFVGVLVAGPYSGAHLNPAVTIGLAIANKFPWNSVPTFMLAQFLGALLGAIAIWFFYKDHFNQTKDAEAKLACFSTGPSIKNKLSNLLSETIGTLVLLMGIFYIKGADLRVESYRMPIGLGSLDALPIFLLVLSIGISLGGTTGFAINPFRDLAPRIVHFLVPISNKGKSNWSYAWIPVLGPMIGAALSALLYLYLIKG